MEIESTSLDDVTTVAVNGRVDSTTADELKNRLDQIVRAGSGRLVVDLNGVSYISSAGFRTLLITARTVQQVNGRLVLCGLSTEVRRLFDIASFSTLFNILPTRDEAVSTARAK